jgi:hypothetical protein
MLNCLPLHDLPRTVVLELREGHVFAGARGQDCSSAGRSPIDFALPLRLNVGKIVLRL